MAGQAHGKRFLGARLAFKDVVHEWKLSLCMVLAISAVLAPLMILFGLKYGTVAVFRNRLIQDPVNREVKPLTSRNYEPAWFQKIRRRPDVAFVVPNTRQIAASMQISLPVAADPIRLTRTLVSGASGGLVRPGGDFLLAVARQLSPRKLTVDIIPTGPGDPLILENGGQVPRGRQCVLSRFAAEKLGASPGDRILARVTRSRGGRIEGATVTLTVRSVLGVRAGTRDEIYVPLSLVDAVEKYKDGREVPAYGWSGEQPLAYGSFDGFILWFNQLPPSYRLIRLRTIAGLTRFHRLQGAAIAANLGFATPAGKPVFRLSVYRRPVYFEHYQLVQNKVGGGQALIVPWVKPLAVTALVAGQKVPVKLFAFSASARMIKRHGGAFTVPWGRAVDKSAPDRLLQAIVPAALRGVKPGDVIRLRIPTKGAATMTVPVRVVRVQAGLRGLLLPSMLMGVFRTAGLRAMSFDPGRRLFLLGRRGYSTFRLYARTIDDVEGLRQYFEAQGIEVSTKAREIERVRAMDRGLTKVFWLVAIVGIAGGLASLIASLLATVERKKRDLSVLRLMGMSGVNVFSFPMANGVYLALGGGAVAIVFFYIMAFFINRALEFLPGEKMCVLPVSHVVAAVALTLAVSGLASLFAAVRAAAIEPAEALRDE